MAEKLCELRKKGSSGGGGTSFLEVGQYIESYGNTTSFTSNKGTITIGSALAIHNGIEASFIANISGFSSVYCNPGTSNSGGCTLDKDFNLVTANIKAAQTHNFLTNEVYFVFNMAKASSPGTGTFTFN